MSRTTINDIARIAGVSKKTVSRVINNSELLSDATRAKVEAVIAQTGFVPDPQARALALGRTMSVAMACGNTLSGIESEVQAGMLEGLRGSGHALSLCPLSLADAAGDLRRFIAQQRPAGLILPPPWSRARDLADLCRAAGVRCIRLGTNPGGRTDAGAIPDGDDFPSCDRLGMATTVSWLVKLGHRRIGIIGGPETSRSAQDRELGYLDAMAEAGLDRGPALIMPGDDTFAAGLEAGSLLLQVSPRPSVIVTCSDETAAGVMRAAYLAGIPVPEDLSIVGFDDGALAAMLTPALTTMRVPWRDMGIAAVRRLLAAQADDLPSDIMPELIIRDSVAPFADQAKVSSASLRQSG